MFRPRASSATFQITAHPIGTVPVGTSPRFASSRPLRRACGLRCVILAALTLTLTAWFYAGSASASQSRRDNMRRAAACALSSSSRRVAGSTASASVAATVQGLREMNYYPSTNAWGGVWYVWRPAMINADMARIALLGANTVRIFLQPASFGYPTPQPQYLTELNQFIGIAASHGLKVHLTLFDLWSSYTDLAGSEQWAAAILKPFHADPRVAVVELQNEIDPTNPAAMAWARTMLPVIRADAGVPVTVSVTGWNSTTSLAQLVAALGSTQPDFYDQHFYGNPPMAATVFSSAQRIAGGKALLIGETGYSTNQLNASQPGIAPTTTAQEAEQAAFFYTVELSAYQAGLPPAAPWTLYDFTPTQYIGPIDQDFGLFRVDGSAKPAVPVIEAAFARAAHKSATHVTTRSASPCRAGKRRESDGRRI
jgi:hypothetical protein